MKSPDVYPPFTPSNAEPARNRDKFVGLVTSSVVGYRILARLRVLSTNAKSVGRVDLREQFGKDDKPCEQSWLSAQ